MLPVFSSSSSSGLREPGLSSLSIGFDSIPLLPRDLPLLPGDMPL
jgi:hypothetical protein